MAEDYQEAGWRTDPFQADCVRYWDGFGWKGRAVTFPEFRGAPNVQGVPDWTFFEKTFNDEAASWHIDPANENKFHWVADGKYTGFVGSPQFLHREICGVLEKYGLAASGTSLTEDLSVIAEKLGNLSREDRWAISDLCRWVQMDFEEAEQQAREQAAAAAAKAAEPQPSFVLAFNAPHSPTTISNQEIPSDATEVGWKVESDDPSQAIFWNTERWTKRISLKNMVLCMFYKLGEDPPKHWDLAASTHGRDMELIRHLGSRSAGHAGWYIDPQSHLMDRNVRYWDGEWTEHIAADAPGWYDDPDHNGNIQYWDGAQWTGQKQNKLLVQANAELAEQEAERKRQRNVAIAMKVFDVGWELAAGRKVQKQTRLMADRRDSDQWERDRQASIRTEAARQQEKFYRNANNRRGW